jgi:hypothetical protein
MTVTLDNPEVKDNSTNSLDSLLDTKVINDISLENDCDEGQ